MQHTLMCTYVVIVMKQSFKMISGAIKYIGHVVEWFAMMGSEMAEQLWHSCL